MKVRASGYPAVRLKAAGFAAFACLQLFGSGLQSKVIRIWAVAADWKGLLERAQGSESYATGAVGMEEWGLGL